MCLISHKSNFVWAFGIVILSGSFFTHVAVADDEPKTMPGRDEQPKTFETAKTETVGQSDSAGSQTSAPQEPKRRALPAPFDPLFPGSEYLGPTPLIGVPDTDPEYPLEKAVRISGAQGHQDQSVWLGECWIRLQHFQQVKYS
jgi:hypothetical protein